MKRAVLSCAQSAYNASDRKLKSRHSFGNFILTDGKIDKYQYDGGYVSLTSDGPRYYYYIKDHLGSNRAVVDEKGEILQLVHYYPFGGIFADAGISREAQEYLFCGKEREPVHGLDTYDFGARQYYNALPLWDRMDPLCEKSPELSPYVYCNDNPVNIIDRDGNWGVKYIDEQNKTMTIIANYYCVSKDMNGIKQFSDEEIRELNKFALQNYSDIGIVSKGEFVGYKVDVLLNFILGDDYIPTKLKAEDDVVNGARIGNLISKSRIGMNRYLQRSIDDSGCISETGGITDRPTGEIVMNEDYCTPENILHEAYHDLGLTHPKGGGKDGIMHYPPQKVSQEEIDKLSEHSNYLYEIFK